MPRAGSFRKKAVQSTMLESSVLVIPKDNLDAADLQKLTEKKCIIDPSAVEFEQGLSVDSEQYHLCDPNAKRHVDVGSGVRKIKCKVGLVREKELGVTDAPSIEGSNATGMLGVVNESGEDQAVGADQGEEAVSVSPSKRKCNETDGGCQSAPKRILSRQRSDALARLQAAMELCGCIV